MKKLYFILTFLVALVVGLKAQQFPVQAQIQMIPPVSPYLSDWSEGFPNRILLNVTLVDGFESGYPVRLRWTITGNGGVTLKTNPNIIPTPITLNFGVPRNLTGAEVAQYLNPDNLEFTGLARNTFIESGGKLPESAGPYTICVEVLDFNRFDGFPVSAPACAIANAIELDPPLLIAPEGVVDALPIQNVLFQWQPTHLGAFPVNYTLQVFEKVEGMSNDLVLQTQVPLFQNQILMNTSYMFGASAPSLTLGKEYIYRVQIIDPLGMNHFKNYGYSEIGSFIYGEEEEEVSCLPPTNGSFAEVTTNSIGVAWNPAAAADNYLVSYRNIDADGNWYEDEVLGENEQIIADLEPATNYEVRVKTLCAGETESDWLTIGATITDSIINPRIYECGDEVILADIDQSTALGSIDAVEFLIYRGFPIFIEDISGSNGNFSGVGKIGLPFGKKNLAVELDVSVNELGEIYAGTVSAIRDNAHNYDLNPEPIVVGEEICQEPEEVIVGFDENGLYQPSGLPYDPFGFGPAGEYIIEPPYVGYEEGDPYDANFDPNGFDANGNYLGTDTPFNEDGCDRLGLDSLGQPCNSSDKGPYFWLNEDPLGAPTEAGLAFVEEIKTNIPPLVVQIVADLKIIAEDSIDIIRPICNGFRETMDANLATLGYNRLFIYGPDDAYYKEGMHENFISAPLPYGVNMQRIPEEAGLEEAHIELYSCDINLYAYIRLLELIINYQEETRQGQLVESLLEIMKRFTAEEVTTYSEEAALLAWLVENVRDIIDNEKDQLYGYQKTTPIQPWKNAWAGLSTEKGYQKKIETAINQFNKTTFSGLTNSLAFNDEALTTAFSALDAAYSLEEKEDIVFQLGQGWEYINGTHRAYFLQQIIEQRKSLSPMDEEAANETLPLAVVKEVGGKEHTIILDNITFGEDGAHLDAFFILALPNSEQKIVFKATNIVFNPGGTTAEATRLSLESEVQMRLSNALQLIIFPGIEDTYIEWDCSGLTEIGISAAVEVCRNYLIPLDPATLEDLPDPERARGYFKAKMQSWGDFIAEVTFDPFRINKNRELKFIVDAAVLDMSEFVSPEQMVVPDNYNSQFISNGSISPLWKGFYMNELSVTLSKELTGSEDVTVGVRNVIIDDLGVTGTLFGAPVLTLEKGTMNGWAFSIDELQVSVVANQLEEIAFDGFIHVSCLKDKNAPADAPITEKDCLGYHAFLSDLNTFSFAVTAFQDYRIPIFQAAEVTLDAGSNLLITKNEMGFKTIATLHGSIEVATDPDKTMALNIPSVGFRDLQISNQAPYFSPGTWELPDIEINAGAFTLSVSNLMFKKQEEEDDTKAVLSMDALVNLTPSSNASITGCSGLQFLGYMEEDGNGRQQWKFEKLKVKDVFINASGQGFGLSGGLIFYEQDEVYGTGFRGVVSAWFRGLNDDGSQAGSSDGDSNSVECAISPQNMGSGTGITAIAQFGAVNGFDYFMVDVLARFDPGLKIGALNLNGIGGGFYSKMSRPLDVTADIGAAMSSGSVDLPALGKSLSGIVYTPNQASGIGFKASVVLSTDAEKAVNTNATFEMNFHAEGGINFISISGNTQFMTEMSLLPEKFVAKHNFESNPTGVAKVSAYIEIYYDFPNSTLHAQADVFFNVENIVRGVGTNDRAGSMVMHFAPDEWYIHIGTPDNRIGLKVDVPLVGSLELSAYLDIGQNLPPIPPLPEYTNHLTGGQAQFMREEGVITSGNGFAFGANLHLDINAEFLILFAAVEAGIGFDLLMQSTGIVPCGTSNGASVGINDYYAQGQAWAMINAAVGIQVKLFGKKKRFSILEVGAGTVLQLKMPNPLWGRAFFGGHYSILNGLVQGEANFRLTIGEECDLQEQEEAYEVPVIDQLVPADGSTDIAVTANMGATFLLPINENYPVMNFETGETERFRIKVTEAKLTHSGVEIPGTIEFTADNQGLTFIPAEFLPAESSLVFTVTVNFEEYANSTYTPIPDAIETKSFAFTTGPGLTNIPLDNITASYPLNDQQNFYAQEYPDKGYVLLTKGQPALMTPPSGQEIIAKITGNGLDFVSPPISYDNDSKRIDFALPSDQLSGNQTYQLQLLSQSTSGGEGSILWATNFRVSDYPTLYAKLSSGAATLSLDPNCRGGFSFSEPFEPFEINGGDGFDKLIQLEATLTSDWYTNDIRNLLYDYYNLDTEQKEAIALIRSIDPMGAPPKKAIYLTAQGLDYDFPMQVKADFGVRQQKAAPYVMSSSRYRDSMGGIDWDKVPKALEDLMHLDFPEWGGEEQFIRIKYYLPGTSQFTTQFDLGVQKGSSVQN